MYYSLRSFCRLKATAACWLVVAVSANAQTDAKVSVDKIQDTLPGLQKGLASMPTAADAPKETSEILRRIRLDQIVYSHDKDKNVAVKGVYLDFANYRDKDPTPWDQIVKRALRTLLENQVILEQGWQLTIDGIKPIDLKEQPHVVLQALANERNLDDVFLATSTFDDQGELQIEGAVSKEIAAKFEEQADAALAELKKFHRSAEGSAKKFYSLKGVRQVDWPLSRLKIQAWLAAPSADPRLHGLRLDRITIKYVPRRDEKAGKDRLQIDVDMKMVALKEDTVLKKDDPLDEVLKRQVEKLWKELVAGRWSDAPAAAADMNRVFAPRNEVSFLEVRDNLQKAIAADPGLDGTLVWGWARYNAAGELGINGICASEEARGHAEEAIKTILRRDTHVADLGVNVSNFAVVDTAEVLRDLAQWAAETHDDVRIERLFFGGPDKPEQLILRASLPAAAKDAVQKEFQALLARDGVLKKIQESRAKGPQAQRPMSDPGSVSLAPADGSKDPEESPPTSVDVKEVLSLTAVLQKVLAERTADPKWRGVLIRRGTFAFENNNRYSLAFILNRKSQEADVRELVKGLANRPAYATYLGKEEPLFTFQEVSLDKMIAKLRDVMPVDPLFDGYRVENAHHDSAGNLVLMLSGVGTPESLNPIERKDPVADVRKALKYMLDSDPLWGLRSRANDRSVLILRYANPKGPVPSNPDIGYLSAVFAARNATGPDSARARDSVRAALLHDPSSSTLWFLSALFNLQEGREDLAKRDLYRVMLLEKDYLRDGPSHYAWAARLHILAPLQFDPPQGPGRWSAEKLLEKVHLEYFDNRPPISMKSSP